MKNRIKRIIFAVLIICILIMPCMSVYAIDTYGYYLEFTVTDTGGTDRTNVPVLLSSIVGTNLNSAGYIDSDGLDTRLKESSTALEYMLSTTNGTMVIPILSAYQTRTFRLYMDYAPDNTVFPVIVGEDGYVTVTDAAALELGNNFEIELDGFINTSAGADKNLVYKENAFKLYVSGEGIISAMFVNAASITPDSTSGSSGSTLYGANYYGQTFTLASNVVITSIGIKAKRTGTVADGVTLSVYATAGGVPTGAALYSNEYDGAGWSTNYEIHTLTLSTPLALSSGVYAFTLASPNCVYNSGSNIYYLAYDSASTYNGGTYLSSSNSGSSWSSDANKELQSFSVNYCYNGIAVDAGSLSSGEHVINVIADATNLKLYVDGVEKDSEALAGASVLNNANDWILFQNNVMPYVNYYKHTVGGTLITKYQPAAMLTSTAVPDLEGAAQNGTITWGANVDLTVTMLGITAYTSYVPSSGADDIADTIKPATMPDSWYSDITDIADLPFYSTFNDKATEMGMPTQTLYVMMMLGTAVAVGLGVLVFTGSAFVAVLVCGVTIAAGVNTGVLSGWMLFIYFIFGVGIMYLSRQN